MKEQKSIPVKHFFMHVGFCRNGLIPVRGVMRPACHRRHVELAGKWQNFYIKNINKHILKQLFLSLILLSTFSLASFLSSYLQHTSIYA